MRAIRPLAVTLLVLALAALAVPAEATIYCDDWCCISLCSRQCWTYDPALITCGEYGMCAGTPECGPSPALETADLGEITSPLVCSDTAGDATAATPVPAEPAD